MEGVRTFLESSTIHGLTHISTTQKYARLFWILVVISGFVGASLLIKESFDFWGESPIKTTVETLPIAEIRFPKVTVCPPKNTFTDLNYDLMMTENMTLTEDMRDEMFKYAVEVLIEDKLSQNNWTKLHEEDRYYNWYHGYSRIQSPSYSRTKNPEYDLHSEYYLSSSVDSCATSGAVTTQYYGEQYQPELVERALEYKVSVNPPVSLRDNENVTLHFKLEKVSMIGLSMDSEDKFDFDFDIEELNDADQTTLYKNFTPPGEERFLYLSRYVSSDEEVDQQKLEMMPGFRLSWWYSGVAEITPDNGFKYYQHNKLFVR